MSKFGDFVKNGWHPEKQGTTFKGQVKGLVGRGESKDDRNKDHVSRPLHTLTDPSSLPPPPQRRGTGLAPGLAPTSSGGEKRKVVAAPSKYQDLHGPRVAPPPRTARVDEQDPEYEQQQQQVMDEPPRPYRTNTTGLRTDHLPPPPSRRDGADGRSPPSYSAATTGRAVPALPGRGAGGAAPSLPPRLPPRGAATPPAASPQSTGSGGAGGLLNQGAVNRLGAAGVSVPGLGIGKSNTGSSTDSQQYQQQSGGGNHMNELQNRFARFNTSSSTNTQEQPAAAAAAPPSQGTTWAQKQAALKTAAQAHKNPSQVSLADARAAAGTANNFRQRHGEQIAAGYGKAQGWNQKYGVADKVGGFASKFQGGTAAAATTTTTTTTTTQEQGTAAAPQETGTTTLAAADGKKKPPPPPPPKKPGLVSAAEPTAAEDAPPPIPMSTRPNF
ncbi:GMP synthase [Beauveria brongniartii RCEF 3172]|uniref:GMP synthase n=1 Tax=Beauveria brongniartii RCEF 3172 TaxID=1081107 RepID=A0A167K0L0_9HYPO|nr:GMP synthase [Beauveria brongniartii RCEF 3172]